MLDPGYAPRAPDTSSADVLGLAAEWLWHCSRLHDCGKRRFCNPDSLPTRIIDIGDTTSTHWRLVVTKDAPITRAEYIALSYCWGDTLQLQLTAKTQGAFMKGVPIAVLPRTHRDLVIVARSLGVRWLWIDALCILQDSKSDWTHESMAMAETFANAKLVVAAAASANSQGGLFRERQVDGLSPLILRQPNRAYMIHSANYWEQHVENSPLFRRGWALQERLLPDRVLYFSDQQVLFECRRQRLCEGFPCNAAMLCKPRQNLVFFEQPTFADSKTDLASKLARNLKIWADIVTMYQKCDFTFESDKLVALAGVIKMAEKQTGDECLAGLWKSRLLFYLGWSNRDQQRSRIPGVDTPSWSWMSMKGAVKWETEMHMMLNKDMDQADVSLSGTIPLARIIEASAEARSKNKNEMMMRGHLQLKASLVKARLLRYRPRIRDGGGTVIVTKYGKSILGKGSESLYLLEMDMDPCLAEAFPDRNFDTSTSSRSSASSPEVVRFHNQGIESLTLYGMGFHKTPHPATFEVVPEAANVFALMLHADVTNGNILSALGLIIVSDSQRPGVFQRIGMFRLAADVGTGKEFMSVNPTSDTGIYKLRGTPKLRDIELV
jgi:hypothetical protein